MLIALTAISKLGGIFVGYNHTSLLIKFVDKKKVFSTNLNLPYLTWSNMMDPPCPSSAYHVQSGITLPYPTLPYPTLPYPTLPYPTLPSQKIGEG